ncbi:uncharacterized protein [Ptychodera flava]|uniref:uncharacterized protein n=1 Tax=Ptychodera flava TaxID=63121 RepID=UPI00396A11BB
MAPSRLKSIQSILLVLRLLSQYSAQNCDLKIESFTITNPDPVSANLVFERDIPKAVYTSAMYVRNDGPDDLTAVTPPTRNYDVKMYISGLDVHGNMDDPIEVIGYFLQDSTDRRSDSLQIYSVAGDEHYYLTFGYSVTYPGDKCLTHSHLCMVIEKDLGATYVDNKSTNDFNCVKFIQGFGNAGLTDCRSEVETSNLVLIPTYAKFITNCPVNITFDIDLKNMGGTKVPGGASNIGFSAFIGNSDSESATIQFDLDGTLMLGNLDAGIDEWDLTTYSGHQVSIQIPEKNCQSYTHFCVVFQNVGNVPDADETNNIVCLSFGESGIGPIDCPAEPTDAVITTVVDVASSPNITAGAVTIQQENADYLSLHVGAVVGIALGSAIAGACLVLFPILLRGVIANRCKDHGSSMDRNQDKENEPKDESVQLMILTIG